MWRIVRLAALPLALLSGCADLNFYSDEQLEPLSAQAYAEASAQYPEVTSGQDFEMVQEVARRIAAAAEEEDELRRAADASERAFLISRVRGVANDIWGIPVEGFGGLLVVRLGVLLGAFVVIGQPGVRFGLGGRCAGAGPPPPGGTALGCG